MTLALPATPRPLGVVPRLVRAGNDLTPPLGGSVQRVNRLGDKFALEVTLPKLKHLSCGGLWASKLMQSASQTVSYPLPPTLYRLASSASPGAPVVNGAGQAGSFLNVRGLTPGYQVLDGHFVSIVTGGKRYLHMLTADVSANGSGVATWAILPMLRVNPVDGAVIEVLTPTIEGFLSMSGGVTVSKFGTDAFNTFTVEEA